MCYLSVLFEALLLQPGAFLSAGRKILAVILRIFGLRDIQKDFQFIAAMFFPLLLTESNICRLTLSRCKRHMQNTIIVYLSHLGLGGHPWPFLGGFFLEGSRRPCLDEAPLVLQKTELLGSFSSLALCVPSWPNLHCHLANLPRRLALASCHSCSGGWPGEALQYVSEKFLQPSGGMSSVGQQRRSKCAFSQCGQIDTLGGPMGGCQQGKVQTEGRAWQESGAAGG